MHQGAAGRSVAAVALLEKHAKTRLAVAADHFNRDYKKGFQFLQVRLYCRDMEVQLIASYCSCCFTNPPWLSSGESWQLAACAGMSRRKPAAKQMGTLCLGWGRISASSYHPSFIHTSKRCVTACRLWGSWERLWSMRTWRDS